MMGTLLNRSKGVLVFGALVIVVVVGLATVQISTSRNYSSLVGVFTKSAAETTKKVKENEPKPSSVTMSNMTVEDMYQRLVYVSALSDNHFKEAKDMFKTVIGYLPKNKLILYNLGLNEEHIKELSAYENVEIRPFPFKNYSSLPHVKNLHTYAWKPIIVKIVSMEYDIIMYGDTSVRLLSCNLTAALQHLLQFPILSGDPLRYYRAIQYTHEGMIKYLHYPASRKDMADVGSIQAGVWLMWANDVMKKKLIDPWVDCALHKECIAPSGAKSIPCGKRSNDGHYIGCHRFDQSALNLILAREFGLDYYSKGTNEPLSHSIWKVRRM